MKKQVGCCRVTFFRGQQGSPRADYVPSVDQVVPDGLI